MRGWLMLLALFLCLGLWLWGLLLGRPWPVQMTLGVPGSRVVGPGSHPAPGTRHPATTPLSLTPSAGAPNHSAALPCAPISLRATVVTPFGPRTRTHGMALGWPGREDGYGVMNGQETATWRARGHGVSPPAQLLLTSLGGPFDGTGTLEVTLVCD